MKQSNNIVVSYKIGDDEIKLSPQIVQEYLTGGQEISLSEFKMFSELCKVRKLNPFLKEAYIIKYGDRPATIVVGKEAILKRAIQNKDYNGREQGIIVQNENGEIEERKGSFYTLNETVVGGWAKVYRKGWDYPTYITVALHEVMQTKKDGTANNNWATKTATMVEKVALVRALRETFIEDLGGMIDEDEAWKNEDSNKIKRYEEHTTKEEPKDPLSEKEINIDEI